eukprot:g5937.t1
MHHFKIDNCQRPEPHDWTVCPFAHAGEKARRRDPARFKYAAIACIDMKNNSQCPRGDDCPYAHNVFEYWMHPTRYRSKVCNDGTKCKRQICFFAHSLDELRLPPRKPGFPPEWHKGRKHKNRNSQRRKASSSPKNERGKGLPEPGNSNTGLKQNLVHYNNNNDNEFLQSACLNVTEASMDHNKTGYAMHDLVSDNSRQLNEIYSPFASIPAIRGHNMSSLGIQIHNEDQCSAPSKHAETSLGLGNYASKLELVLNALGSNVEDGAKALTQQSPSEYVAYAPVIPTAFGSTQSRMNLDVDRRQLFPTVSIDKVSVMDTATYNSSLSPPCQVRFSPETAPFPGMGSDQDSPIAPLRRRNYPKVSVGRNPLDYSRLLGEGIIYPSVSHEPSIF